jgi:hypothetical protein
VNLVPFRLRAHRRSMPDAHAKPGHGRR